MKRRRLSPLYDKLVHGFRRRRSSYAHYSDYVEVLFSKNPRVKLTLYLA